MEACTVVVGRGDKCPLYHLKGGSELQKGGSWRSRAKQNGRDGTKKERIVPSPLSGMRKILV